ncbi:MAG: hypothetical protein K9G24_08525, partial [Candidatus Nanopelagicales bacterium]|nr:hypothetical protein [Candidatus Nanopelagicales bacterium]
MSGLTARRWFGPLIGLITFVVVLLVGAAGAVVTDVVIRNAELTILVSEVEASEQQMIEVQEEIDRVSQEFEAIPEPTDEDRAELVGQLADVAAYGQEAIAAAAADVASLEFVVWHSAIRQAQSDYLAHNQAWQDYLERAAVDPGELTLPQEDINSTFEQSKISMNAAIPSISGDALRDRVDLIYAEPEP